MDNRFRYSAAGYQCCCAQPTPSPPDPIETRSSLSEVRATITPMIEFRSVEDLCRATRAGRSLRYLYFWGHRPERGGGVGRGCLSQWWPAAFTVDGVRYTSAEHFMMAGKARLFGDVEMLPRILAATSPAQAKAFGGRVRGFVEEVWREHRSGIVTAANVAKFGQHDDLREYLLATRGRVLVEASPRDRVWGIGLAATDPRAADPARWRGTNLLGFALMRARSTLAT
ncbi:NADAR domain-containing protein [Actinocatenispora rupis]|uniref:NADAR domain-containing protein n=2 Tax=Actinocatenispora rupis TaxID=519421 RepID=A0A8J3NEF6_9ACTN|nr:hypothetical protein Aru02nite_47990 [Actinocatenispora rupis]